MKNIDYSDPRNLTFKPRVTTEMETAANPDVEGILDFIIRKSPEAAEYAVNALASYLIPEQKTAYSDTVLDEYWMTGTSAGQVSGSYVDPIDINALVKALSKGNNEPYVSPGMLGKQKIK
jgi:hypothetical protein